MISGSLFGLELRRSKFYYISSSSLFFPEVCEAASCFPHEPVYIEFNNEPNFQHKLICDFL